MPVILVERRQTLVLVTRDREGEGRWAAGIGEERREKVVDLVGDSVELVTQAVTQGQIRNNLVGILDEGIELLLTKPRGSSGARLPLLSKNCAWVSDPTAPNRDQTMFCSVGCKSTNWFPV